MTPAAVQARKDYMKKWRAKNKDRSKEYQARHWERKAAREAEVKEDGQQ